MGCIAAVAAGAVGLLVGLASAPEAVGTRVTLIVLAGVAWARICCCSAPATGPAAGSG